ncbi:unnamed protein product [Blepharisma stoltei]|uniref:V-SNARE coiled-coil homology domain-containing protein n=1 Tax=Blepharisma stoltei TaxID=1481888 RepID=A0AAU9JZJ2_9CILI|nr:unnamed protein product [Blepharisma stoltei]
MSENILCLAIGRFDDRSILAELIPSVSIRQAIRKEIFSLLSEKPEVEWMVSSDSQFGLWSMIANNDICYMFLGPKNYPSHLVNSLLFDIKTALKDKKYSEQEVLEIMSQKYRNSNGQDKVKNLTTQVKQVQELAYVGIQKVLENTEVAENLSVKTDELASTSYLLNQQSKRLSRQLYWRNFKLRCIVGIVIAAVLLYLIISLFSEDDN